MAIGKFMNSFYIPIVPFLDGNGRVCRRIILGSNIEKDDFRNAKDLSQSVK